MYVCILLGIFFELILSSCYHSQLLIELIYLKDDNENDKLLLRFSNLFKKKEKIRTDISINCNNNKKKIGIFSLYILHRCRQTIHSHSYIVNMHSGNKSYNDIVQKQMNNMVSLLVNK